MTPKISYYTKIFHFLFLQLLFEVPLRQTIQCSFYIGHRDNFLRLACKGIIHSIHKKLAIRHHSNLYKKVQKRNSKEH